MYRPYIVCHMVTSIDGKVTGEFLSRPECESATEIYYEMNREYKAQGSGGFICGRVTMEGSFTGGWYPDLSEYKPVARECGHYMNCWFDEALEEAKLRTIKGALRDIRAFDEGSAITEYKIRWLIKNGRLRSYAVGTREIIVMESFDDENLLTQESREGCNVTQGIKLSEQYSELLSKTTQSYTCTRRR